MPPQRRRRTRRQNNNAEEEEELSSRPPPGVSTRTGRSRSRSPHQGNVRERNGNVRQRQRNEHVERQHDNTRQRNENAGHERNESARGLLENVRQRNENGANMTISISVPSSGVQTASNGVTGEDVNRGPDESEDDIILVSNSDSDDGGSSTRSYEVNLALDLSVPLSDISDFSEIDLPHSSTQISPPTMPQFLQEISDVIRDTTARVRARVMENLDLSDVVRQTTAQALQDFHDDDEDDDDDGIIIGDTSIAYEPEIDEYVYSSSETELTDSESNTSNSEESPSSTARVNEDQRRRPFCLSEHVQGIPAVTVGGADLGCRCGVCIEDFVMGERDVIKLPCSHLHHRECFQQWVDRDKRSCPVCRRDVQEAAAAASTAAHSS